MKNSQALNYELAGDPGAPAVLFLHGFMGSSADWRGVGDVLRDRAFCIAVDLPGHGSSLGRTSAAYSIEGAARAVKSTLDGLGVERPLIAGYSMGGRLALYLALRHPERCAGLFLESASPGLRSAEERAARVAADESLARRLESEDFGRFVSDWYRRPLFATLARNEELLARTVDARPRNDPVELARSLRGMGVGSQPSLWGDLAGLAVPAVAAAGEWDEKYAAISSRMDDANPRIGSALVRGAGHNVHEEAPAAYLDLLGGFLDVGRESFPRAGSFPDGGRPIPYNPSHD